MAIITLKGSQFNTIGELPMVGTQAPDFTMTREDMTEVRLSDCHGKMTVLNIFPSLDTPTCAAAMKHFNKIAKQFPDAMIVLDKESRVVHTELVEELANEPNYQAALDCITSQNAV